MSCVSAEDSNTNSVQDQTTLTSVQSPTVTATNDRYVNIKIGNDSWDGTSSTYVSGTIGPKQHISSGLNVSVNSGNLYIAAGTYKESKLTVAKNLTIIGEGKTNTTIDASDSNLIFWIKPGTVVTIRNLNITNGTASRNDFSRNGGGIYNQGTLIIDNCIFYNNQAQDADNAGGTFGDPAPPAGNGGAIYNTGTLTITNSEFYNNHAGDGGDASATHNGSAGGSGGAIYNAGLILNIQACTFRNNYAGKGGASSGTLNGHSGGSGGAIYNTGTINNILNCTFSTNHAGFGGSTQAGAAANPGAGGNGGAIFSNNTVTVTSCTFDGNYAGNGGDGSDIQDGAQGGYGGAIYNTGTFTISGSETLKSVILNNHVGKGGAGPGAAANGADGNGGAISNLKTLTIINCEIHNNTANNGGGIYNSASLTLQNSRIYDNSANNGAGIFNENQTNIINTETYNNKAGNNGGGIWNSATLTLNNLTIRNNTAGNTGGGIYNSGILTLNNFIITQNTANNGGGIGNANKLYLYNSNITSNTATTHGGGIYNTNLIYLVNTQVINNNPDNIYGSLNCVVNNRTNELYNTIQAAINNASPNDTLLIQKGTYKENLSITKTINLTGSGQTNTIIDGQQKARCISINGAYKVTITNLTITNGLEEGNGGGIWNNADLSLTNVTISNNACELPNAKADKNSVRHGGGIYNSGGNLTLTNCTISNNHCWINYDGDLSVGGGVYNSGNLTVINCTFSGNWVGVNGQDSDGGDGGGIYNAGNLTVTNSTFQNNKANCCSIFTFSGYKFVGGHGGAIYNTGNMTATNNTFTLNIANNLFFGDDEAQEWHHGGGFGGAIYNEGSINLTNNRFNNNTGVFGGAIYNTSILSLRNDNYTNNAANGVPFVFSDDMINGKIYSVFGGYGGAIYTTNNINMTNCTFTNNTAISGGSIYSTGNANLTVSNSNFTDNNVTAYDKNGKPFTYLTYDTSNPMEIVGAVFMILSAATQGLSDVKCYWANSIWTLISSIDDLLSRIQKNTVEASGGAIYLEGSSNLNLTNCIFNNNTASLGGAIDNFGNGTLNVIGSTFNNNTAGEGGAIYSNNLGPLNVTGSIFNNNNGQTGGAIFYGGTTDHTWADCTIKENIFTGNIGYLGGVFYLGIQGTTHSVLNFNRIYGTGNYDIYNEYPRNDSRINCLYNWWGSNDGPGAYNTNDNTNTLLDPWMVLTVTANPSTITYGSTSTINADLLHDSRYDPSKPYESYHNPIDGQIPDGLQITFKTDDGNITPLSSTIVNGQANATYVADVTAAPKVVTVFANVDNTKDHVATFINIAQISTKTYLNPVSNFAGQSVTLVAKVTDGNDKLIDGGNVIFNIGIAPSVTEPVINGYAEHYLTIPLGTLPLPYTISANYTGTVKYASSTVNQLLIVNQATSGSTGVTVYPPVTGKYGDKVNLTARLTDVNTNLPLSNKNVAFSVNGTSVGSANTDANGVATVSYTIILPPGSYTILASFAGVPQYSSSSNTGMLNVNPLAMLGSDLEVTKTIQSIVRLGHDFNLTIKVENKGPEVAKDVIITSTIPEVFKFVSASVSQGTWSYDKKTGIFTWNLGDVNIGDTYLYLTLRATKLGKYSLSQTLTSRTNSNLENDNIPLIIQVNA